MVLRCSLLGHEYGDLQIERRREEQGSEVVLTVEEYRACIRCDERKVVSENTEVTTLVDADTGEPAESAASPSVGGQGDGSQRDRAQNDDPGTVRADDGFGTDRFADEGVPTTPEGDPIVDDGEILEDEPEEPAGDREYGQWPDSADVGPPVAEGDGPAAWPDSDSTPEARATNGATTDDTSTTEDSTGGHEYTFAETMAQGADEPIEDDAIVLDDTTSTGGMRGADEVATETDLTDQHDEQSTPETVFSSPDEDLSPGNSPSRDGLPTEFYCPRCEFVAPGSRGSLRSGDICPDCQKGFLGERPQ